MPSAAAAAVTEVAPEGAADAVARTADTPWLVPVRAALGERLDQMQQALGATTDPWIDQTTAAIARAQQHIQTQQQQIHQQIQQVLRDPLPAPWHHQWEQWQSQWHSQWDASLGASHDRAIANLDAIATGLTTLRKLRPDAFRQSLTTVGHGWIDAHPLLVWLLAHPLWGAALAIAVLSVGASLLGLVGSALQTLGRSLLTLPIGLGRSLAQRLHRPDLAEVDRTFERLYGDRFAPPPRDRLGHAIARLEALNREQAALLQEIQTLSGQAPSPAAIVTPAAIAQQPGQPTDQSP